MPSASCAPFSSPSKSAFVYAATWSTCMHTCVTFAYMRYICAHECSPRANVREGEGGRGREREGEGGKGREEEWHTQTRETGERRGTRDEGHARRGTRDKGHARAREGTIMLSMQARTSGASEFGVKVASEGVEVYQRSTLTPCFSSANGGVASFSAFENPSSKSPWTLLTPAPTKFVIGQPAIHTSRLAALQKRDVA
jgi:hypothetical protein